MVRLKLHVDPPRIELGIYPCEGYGIPFTYGPNRGSQVVSLV